MDTVRVHFASLNTAPVSELCIRSMRATAGHPFVLTVGDCGSTDGSIAMFERFARQGRLELEVAPNGRLHPEWLDQWYAACDTKYAVICDSDVEFRRPGWLRDMVEAAQRSQAALVATRIQAKGGVPYVHPVTGARRTLAARPEPWLMLLDVEQLRPTVTTSFAYVDEVRDDGSKVGYDTAAAFFRDLDAAGLKWVEMPPDFAQAYRHYSGLTWQRRGMPWRRHAKQLAKRSWVWWRLQRRRGLDVLAAKRAQTPV